MFMEAREDVVRRCIAEALAEDVETIKPDGNLMADYDADSLAFLDIVFRLEQAFGIQITRGEMDRAARGEMSEDDFAPNGVVSDAGLQRLRELMPESADRIKAGLKPQEILTLFTVRTFTNIVSGKQEGKEA